MTLMWLEAVLGLCLGCEIYGALVRRGWIAKDEAFEICSGGACARRRVTARLEDGHESRRPPLADRAGRVRERIVGIDQTVPVLDGALRPYVNLDNAASTPALREVLDTVNDFMHWYSSVHRGTGFKSKVATQAYDDARHIVAALRRRELSAITPSSSARTPPTPSTSCRTACR